MTPGPIDRPAIERRLETIDRRVQQLRRLAPRAFAVDEPDDDLMLAIERGLHLCAQATLDVATHLAASAGHAVPDYAAAIDVLGRIGVLPAAFAGQIRELAGFRNALVHLYLDLDRARVLGVLRAHLDDFEAFARHIVVYLDAECG